MSMIKGFTPIGDDFKNSANPQASGTRGANREKLDILERYALVFEEDNVFTYNILPILLSKPYLLSKMEMFYDRQFEELLKKKSLTAMDFPHVVHESMKSKFRESKNYFVQSLSNVVYSAERYSQDGEVGLFLEFCLKRGENQKLLFYLFLRQHFKILTYTTFLSHYKTSQDPSKIAVSFDNACDIVTVAFSHEKIAQEKLLTAIRSAFTKTQKIQYYEFMMACMNVRMIYGDLPMLEKAISLYKVTNFAELTNALGQKNLIDINTSKDAGLSPSPNKVGAHPNDLSQLNQSRENATSSKGDRFSTSRPRSDWLSSVNPKSKQFFNVVRTEIKPTSERIINVFIEKQRLDPLDTSEQFQVVNQHIQKKLYFIVCAIFAEDRRRFLGVLRTDIETNPQVLDFWMDLQDSVKETQRMGLINANVAQDFLRRIYSNPSVTAQIVFLLNFRLKKTEEQFDCTLALSNA
jgi:hypothetical protein